MNSWDILFTFRTTGRSITSASLSQYAAVSFYRLFNVTYMVKKEVRGRSVEGGGSQSERERMSEHDAPKKKFYSWFDRYIGKKWAIDVSSEDADRRREEKKMGEPSGSRGSGEKSCDFCGTSWWNKKEIKMFSRFENASLSFTDKILSPRIRHWGSREDGGRERRRKCSFLLMKNWSKIEAKFTVKCSLASACHQYFNSRESWWSHQRALLEF